MSPDDLIAAFNEVARIDPDMRIDRSVIDDRETIRLANAAHRETAQDFKAAASDAAERFDQNGFGDPVSRWLRLVFDQAPEKVEASLSGNLGYAIEDGKRVRLVAETIPNAAKASVLAVRRCREGSTPQPPPFRVQPYSIPSPDEEEGGSQARHRQPLPVDYHAGELGATATADAPAYSTPTVEPIADEAYLSPTKLAENFLVPANALRKRLGRWRMTHHEGWIENAERKPREAQYLYQVSAVRAVVESLRVSSQASSERPAKKL